MGTDRLRVAPNERVDISDFEFLAGEGTQASLRQIGHKVLMEESVVRNQDMTGYILDGFAISNPAASQLRVTKGRAILSQRLNGAVVQGIVTTEGDATITVDLNSYAAGDYGIYIRFEEIESDDQGRIFWNPTGDGSEYVDTVSTRYVAKWSLRVESASPGTEWLLIGEVAQATMVITDKRPFYFEGMPHTTTAYQSGWSTDGDGLANDRNADRATYGVGDFHTFIRAVKQCLEDIKGRGLKRWWDRDISGMNIGFDADPTADQLAVGDANFHLTNPSSTPRVNFDSNDYLEYVRGFNLLELTIGGSTNHIWNASTYTTENMTINNYLYVASGAGEGVQSHLVPESVNSRDLGNASYPWRGLFLSDVDDEGVGTNFIPDTDNTHDLGKTNRRWQDAFLSGTVKAAGLNVTGIGPNITGSLVPTGAYNFGTSGNPWTSLWLSGTATIDTAALDHLEVSDTATEGVGTNLVPDQDGVHNLGNSSYEWNECRVRALIVSLADGGDDGCNSLYPFVDSVYHLGKDARRWGDAFIDCLYESEASYLWSYVDTQIAISSPNFAVITPKTEIENNILSVNGSGLLTASKTGKYHGSCTFRIGASAADTLTFSIALYKNTGALGAMQLVTNSDQLFKETFASGSDWKNFSYNFIADLTGSGDEITIRCTHLAGTSDIVIEANSHLIMGKSISTT